jgi:hypothetical protein
VLRQVPIVEDEPLASRRDVSRAGLRILRQELGLDTATD